MNTYPTLTAPPEREPFRFTSTTTSSAFPTVPATLEQGGAPRTGTVRASQPAVHCEKVYKDFGDGEARVQVLRGVNLEVHPGKLTFLVGPSGCGKTTLISVIAGLLDRSGGKVELFGQDLEALPPRERILFRRKNLGFVYQQFNLLPALTAAENAAVPLLAAGLSRA